MSNQNLPLATQFLGNETAEDSRSECAADNRCDSHEIAVDHHVYSEWRADSGDPSGFTFYVKRSADGLKATARLMPWIKHHTAALEELKQQIGTIKFLDLETLPQPIEFDVRSSTFRLILVARPTQPLLECISQLQLEQRLSLAFQLCDTLAAMTRIGLTPDSHCLSNLQLEFCDSRVILCLGCLAKFYSDANYASAVELSTTALAPVLRQIVGQASLDATASCLSNRERASLQSLLSNASINLELHEFLDQCVKSLSRFNTRLEQESKPSGLDRKVLQSIDKAVDLIDQTIETEVQLPPPGEVDDESTSELGCSSLFIAQNCPQVPRVGDTLGRYRLEGLLGEGGMGLVFRATDIISQRPAAVKVLRGNHQDIAHAVRRFRKEARILASVRSQYVTQLYEVGVADGFHFLAMEFIDGTNLKEYLKGKLPLPEADALRIVADIARGLLEAHRQEIIHRDIKPENVLMSAICDLSGNRTGEYQIKLTDFGIARHVHQSASLEVTRVGSLLGTPAYMSPEQCKSTEVVGPAADVYSLGVTLYMMLSGSLPFVSDDPMKLTGMHCFSPVPNLQKANGLVSDATAQLVYKMLAKSAQNRIADASQLVRAIDLLTSGESNSLAMHPSPPSIESGKVWERNFEWELKSSPTDLWPHVSNTDRLNRAAGLQAVSYRSVQDEQLGLRKFGSFRLGGIQIEWEEHPFEWVEGHRMGVLREFSTGPFRWFISTVELTELPGGGCRLQHRVQILPRNTLGRIVSTIEAGWKGFRALDRIYRRIDDSIQRKNECALQDPFEVTKKLKSAQAERLTCVIDELVSRGIDLAIAQQLVDYVRIASPKSLACIRPLELAELFGCSGQVMINACLIAASCRLLQLKWDIICPTCRVSTTSTDLLSQIETHTHCEACDLSFQSNLSDAIELIFQAHPDVREVDNGKYCVGGPEHAPHIVSQLRLQPGERVEFQVTVPAGDYLLRSARRVGNLMIKSRNQAAATEIDIVVSQFSGGVAQVRAGLIQIAIKNDLAVQQLVKLERVVTRKNIVTAARVASVSKFRELFPHQVFRREVPMVSDEVTLLAAQFHPTAQQYRSLGEVEVYVALQKSMSELETRIESLGGVVVKTFGDALIASFERTDAAVLAAIRSMSQAADTNSREVPLSLIVHRGQALVTNQNGRLDYFGVVPRHAMELLEHAEDQVLLTADVFSDYTVQETLKEMSAESPVKELTMKDGERLLVRCLSMPALSLESSSHADTN